MPQSPSLTLAARTQQVAPSATLAMAARANALKAAGKDILSMAAGEPDFDTPDLVKRAAADAMARGESKYTPVAGSAALKRAVGAYFAQVYGRQPSPAETICSTGGKQVLFNALGAIVDPGDEVLMAAPYWVSYPDMVRLFGGVPKAVSPADGRALPSADAFAGACGPRTRAVILNSPSNPAGSVYTKDALTQIAQWLRQAPHLFIICDDIYSGLVYDAPFLSLLHLAPELAPRLLVASGVSKTFAMTGWRIGWGVGPAPLIAAMADLQGAATSGACSIAQAAAASALTQGHADATQMAATFARRRDRMVAALAAHSLPFTRPQGAFYVMVDVSAWFTSRHPGSQQICEHLLEASGLEVVPGDAFGAEGFVRLSFACSDADIDEGVRRLADGLGRLG